jgi:plasmid stabilization system protein ParE
VPHVIVTEGAADGLERCRQFLVAKAPEAARRAGQAIERQFLLLETAPDIGRPFPEMPELRELVIAFGDSGYVALYRHEPAADAVYVWHSVTRKRRATDERFLPGQGLDARETSPFFAHWNGSRRCTGVGRLRDASSDRMRFGGGEDSALIIVDRHGDLMDRVVTILDQARNNVVRAVNSNMVIAYWLIGREIVQGAARRRRAGRLRPPLACRTVRGAAAALWKRTLRNQPEGTFVLFPSLREP